MLHRRSQFPDIPGPSVMCKLVQDRPGKLQTGFLILFREIPQEMVRQNRYVIYSLPQRRKKDLDDTNPEKQILPELSFFDHDLQIPVGGSY